MRVNTINFSVNSIRSDNISQRKEVVSSREGVTSFQKSTLKRLKAKESIIIKKKRISR